MNVCAHLVVPILFTYLWACAPNWTVHDQELSTSDAVQNIDSTFVKATIEHGTQQSILKARWYYLRALDNIQISKFESAQNELDKAYSTLTKLQERDQSESQAIPILVPNESTMLDSIADDIYQLTGFIERTYLKLLPNLETLSPESPISVLLQGLSAERIEDLQPDTGQIVRIHQLASQCDIPIDANARVAASIHFFQTKGRDTYMTWMRRSGKYRSLILNVLRGKEIPEDFLYLAMIESGFKPRAYSRAKAVGLWQFMLRTGELNGLHRTHWVDERRDPMKSTRAAAAHLKDLFDFFGDWRLAAAAYNSGRGRVSRAIAKAGSRDFWQLELPKETRNYVPLLMATTIISKDPTLFGFDIPNFDKPDNIEHVIVPNEVHLPTAAKILGIEYNRLRDFNPELRRHWTPLGKPYSLTVPYGSGASFVRTYTQLPDSDKPSIDEYVVRNGDNISTIASTFAVSAQIIANANGIQNADLIHPGQKLFIPLRHISSGSIQSTSNVSASSVLHSVKRGESLSVIAHRYRIKIADLKRWNGLNNNLIHPGDILHLKLRTPNQTRLTGPRLASMDKTVHRVMRGETLWGLSQQYNVKIANLLNWNGLTDSTIKPGQSLIITLPPKPDYKLYTVIQGDTLYSIARQFGSDVQTIARQNNMSLSTILLTGMKLRVPTSQIHFD